MKTIKFEYELNEVEQKRLNKWTKAIKFIYGEVGSLTYKFTPTGIGVSVSVYSDRTKTEIDVTDYDSW